MQKPFEVVKTEEFVPQVMQNSDLDPSLLDRIRDLETQAIQQKTVNLNGKSNKQLNL